MDFLITLALRYAFYTAAIFLLGAIMRYFFDGEEDHLGKAG